MPVEELRKLSQSVEMDEMADVEKQILEEASKIHGTQSVKRKRVGTVGSIETKMTFEFSPPSSLRCTVPGRWAKISRKRFSSEPIRCEDVEVRRGGKRTGRIRLHLVSLRLTLEASRSCLALARWLDLKRIAKTLCSSKWHRRGSFSHRDQQVEWYEACWKKKANMQLDW